MSQLKLSSALGWGGPRPGAGRPKKIKSAPTTKTIRVPVRYANSSTIAQLIALKDLIDDYQLLSDGASPTSPRWDKMREFLDSAKMIGPDVMGDGIPF